VMSSLLVGVTATDPPTYVAIAVLFLIIATIATWLPARHAADLNPNEALRVE
jgi:putative ABC transport system permease protein